jgi:hypothetical protein
VFPRCLRCYFLDQRFLLCIFARVIDPVVANEAADSTFRIVARIQSQEGLFGFGMRGFRKNICVGNQVKQPYSRCSRFTKIAVNENIVAFAQALADKVKAWVNQFFTINKRRVFYVNHIEGQGLAFMTNTVVIWPFGSSSAFISQKLPMIWVFAGMNYPPAGLMLDLRFIIRLCSYEKTGIDLFHIYYLVVKDCCDVLKTNGTY